MLFANTLQASIRRRRVANVAKRVRERLAIESLERRLALATDGPTFTSSQIQIIDKTDGTLPANQQLYILLPGYTIDTDGTVTAGNPSAPTPLSAITNKVNGHPTITLGEAFGSNRLYVTTSPTMTTQPPNSGNSFYFDFIEPNFQKTKLNVDTTQVDQFGIPMQIQVIPNDSINPHGSGVNSGIGRAQIFQLFKHSMVSRFAAYQDSIVTDPQLGDVQILAPQNVLNSQYGTGVQQQTTGTTATIKATGGLPGGWKATIEASYTFGAITGNIVTGPFIPPGTYVESVASDSKSAVVVNPSTSTTNPFPSEKPVAPPVNGTGLNFSPVPAKGFSKLAEWYGPTWKSTHAINETNPIDDFFKHYKTNTFWQQDNGTTELRLYEGKTKSIKAANIEGGISDYAVMQFTGGDYASKFGYETYNIFYPYFTTNSPAGKLDPFGKAVPPPPSYFSLGNPLNKVNNFISPSQMVFGASGVFADNTQQGSSVASVKLAGGGSGYSAAPKVTFSQPDGGTAYFNATAATGTAIIHSGQVIGIEMTNPGYGYVTPPTITIDPPASGTAATASAFLVKDLLPVPPPSPPDPKHVPPVFGNTIADLERDINAALIRGYATTILSTSNAVGSTALPTFAQDQTDNLKGTWTLTSAADVDIARNVQETLAKGRTVYLNSFKQSDFPMTIDAVKIEGGKAYITATNINRPTTYPADNLQFFELYADDSTYDAYSAFFQSKGAFAQARINGETVNIGGRAYGDAFSDYMGFSSDIEADVDPTGPASQMSVLQITLTSWGSGSSLTVVSGDFDGNGLDDIAEFKGTGHWQVALTTSSTSTVNVNAGAPWTTDGIVWKDFTVVPVKNGSDVRDVIVARASGSSGNSWWKLWLDGSDWKTHFIGSWSFDSEWLNIVAGDFDGDGKTDIAGRTHDRGEWWMLADAAKAIDPSSASQIGSKNVKIGEWHPHVQWEGVAAGNFDGAASPRDSIAGLTGTTWWQLDYIGTGTPPFTNTIITTNWSNQKKWSDFVVGNFSGDATVKQGIAARDSNNSWYTVSNTGNPSQQPTLMAALGAGVWKNVVVGNFAGDSSGAVGIASRNDSTGEWTVVQKQGAGYQGVNYQGAWPISKTWAQAFAGVFNSQSGSPKKCGILGRSAADPSTWQLALSLGASFKSSSASGYPS